MYIVIIIIIIIIIKYKSIFHPRTHGATSSSSRQMRLVSNEDEDCTKVIR